MNELNHIPVRRSEEKIQISPMTAEAFIDQTIQFQVMMMMYSSAIKEVITKFQILNDDIMIRNKRNPIESITHRVKNPVSILEKLERHNLDVSPVSIFENLNDVAGVRIICSFIDDIYQVADMFICQDDVKLIGVKDYIKNPKPNGYRSYHMIVEIPVFFSDRKENMKVEIQLRTIAMDFWASLEHQLRYKKNIKNEEEISRKLFECAEIISTVDMDMQDIRKQIDENADNEPEDFQSKLEKLGNGFMKSKFS